MADTTLAATLWKIKLLTAAAQYFNLEALQLVGGHPGENRGGDILEQVIAAPFQTFAGEEIHPDPFEKAALLMRGVTQGHPFGDGNKRTGLLIAAYYLEQMGYRMPDEFGVTDTTEFCLRVSAGDVRDVGVIADQLRAWWRQ